MIWGLYFKNYVIYNILDLEKILLNLTVLPILKVKTKRHNVVWILMKSDAWFQLFYTSTHHANLHELCLGRSQELNASSCP